MNEQNRNGLGQNESVLKFIYPVAIMAVVQILVQLFAGQLLFFYKGYTYSEGTYDDFMNGYQASLASDKFTLLVSALSTLILVIVFLFWYRKEIIHAANVSLRNKLKIRGQLNWFIIPGVILVSLGAGVFATYISYFVALIKPDLLAGYVDVVSVISDSEPGLLNVILLVYFVVLSPVCQELVFRGLTLGFAERRMNFVAANLMQAILCGVFTMNITQMIYYFLFGLVLGYVYYRTENIIIPIICNMLFCVTRLVFYDVSIIGSSLVTFYVIFFLAMAICYGGIVLVKKSKIIKAKDNM